MCGEVGRGKNKKTKKDGWDPRKQSKEGMKSRRTEGRKERKIGRKGGKKEGREEAKKRKKEIMKN